MDRTVNVIVEGAEAIIHGRAGDAYFDQMVGEDHNNSFLAYVLRDHLSADPVIFDVGANIGLTAVMASRRAGPAGAVHAFEPGPEAYSLLEQTVAANALSNVTLHNIALGSTEGDLPFEDASTSSASHLSPAGTSLGSATRTVRVRKLDDVAQGLSLSRLDLIKIDVEGHEMGVLDGAALTIEMFKPVVFIEFNSFTLQAYGNQYPRAVLERLRRDFGKVFHIGNSGLKQIESDYDLLAFLHTNLTAHGCVDDLLLFP